MKGYTIGIDKGLYHFCIAGHTTHVRPEFVFYKYSESKSIRLNNFKYKWYMKWIKYKYRNSNVIMWKETNK